MNDYDRPVVTVNMNRRCEECRKPGATPNGLCLRCVMKSMGDKPMRSSQRGGSVARSKDGTHKLPARMWGRFSDGKLDLSQVMDVMWGFSGFLFDSRRSAARNCADVRLVEIREVKRARRKR